MAANSDNLYKGTGIAYFKRTGESSYRDLGSVALVETTPEVTKLDKFMARGGKRTKFRTFVTQQTQSFAVNADEWNTENLALALGGTPAAAVNLSTTGNTTNNSPTLASLASVTGLVEGRRYFVSGAGIPTNASFIYEGSEESPDTGVTMDRNATATGTGVALTITAPAAFTVFGESQITGAFLFVSDNDVGPRIRMEALNAIITPNGTLGLLDSSGDEPGMINLTVDVFEDDYGNGAQFYNDGVGGTVWVPA